MSCPVCTGIDMFGILGLAATVMILPHQALRCAVLFGCGGCGTHPQYWWCSCCSCLMYMCMLRLGLLGKRNPASWDCSGIFLTTTPVCKVV